MDSKLFVLNWKMNPQKKKEAEGLFKTTENLIEKTRGAEVVVCPPFSYLARFGEILKKEGGRRLLPRQNKVRLGAQNCFFEERGAYTGEISALMLKDIGCSYVILGHSERRLNFNESDEMINKKIKAAARAGLNAVLCVGEKARNGNFDYFDFVKNQIEAALLGFSPRYLRNLRVAYEPVWAISANRGAEADDPRDISTMAVFIRKTLFGIFNSEAIFGVPVLYGGSVNKNNIKNLLETGDEIGGFLVGGASLKKEELKGIFANFTLKSRQKR